MAAGTDSLFVVMSLNGTSRHDLAEGDVNLDRKCLMWSMRVGCMAVDIVDSDSRQSGTEWWSQADRLCSLRIDPAAGLC